MHPCLQVVRHVANAACTHAHTYAHVHSRVLTRAMRAGEWLLCPGMKSPASEGEVGEGCSSPGPGLAHMAAVMTTAGLSFGVSGVKPCPLQRWTPFLQNFKEQPFYCWFPFLCSRSNL